MQAKNRRRALGCAVAFGVLAAGGPPAPAQGGVVHAPTRPEAGDQAHYREDYLRFTELLVRFRQGEDEVLEPLRAAGKTFAERHGRTDAPRVVEVYAQLTRAERERGWQDYLRFADLWARVGEQGTDSWEARREALLVELRALCTEVRGRADEAPAGRASSLCARIAVHELESAAPRTRAEREALARAARADAEAALAIFERAEQRTPRLEPAWTLACLDRLAGRPDRAEERLELLAREARALRADDYRQHALLGLVRLARARGDAARVDRLLAQLAEFRDPRTCWPLAKEHSLRLLAQDAPQSALEFLERVAPSAPAERRAWTELVGLAHLRAGDLEAARRALEEGGGELARWTLEVRAGRGLAVTDELLLLGEDPRAELPARLVALSLAGEALLAAGRAAPALDALERAIDLAARHEARLEDLALLDEGAASVVGERLGLHTIELAARAACALGRELEAAALAERHQSRALRAPELGAAQIAAWAARYEHGLVTFVCGADAALAIHVAPDGGARAFPIEHPRRALSDAVRRLREAAIAGAPERLARLGQELGAALLPPALVGSLRAGPADGRLLFLLHGPLERLPLEALWVDGALLDERCAPLALPGLPDAEPGPTPALGTGWIALGDPLGADGAPRLPAARAELEAVAAAHPGTRLAAGGEFDRAALVDALQSGAPLHVATHLVRAPGCGAQRLAPFGLELTGGGLLCAEEVLALGPRSPLVVLSACESAEGRFLDAEGLQGLARAFLEAGTRNLLVTLWPVEDDAARAACERFHLALAAGCTPSTAAREARSALRAAGAPAADWAAFRLLGRD